MAKEQYLDFKGLQQYDAIVEEKIRRAVAGAVGFEVVVVNSLPNPGEEHILYLVPNIQDPTIHDEYLWVNNNWEKIGNTDIDLSLYATITYVNESISSKVDNSELEKYASKNDVSVFITEDALAGYALTETVNNELEGKADKSQLSDYATNASLAEKQDEISDLDTIRENASNAVQPNDISAFITIDDLTGYATTENVNASLELKADKETVNASLADINLAINDKADSNYVNEHLAEKANLSYVDASLELKVDVSVLEENYYTKTDIDALITRISVLESTVVTLKDNIELLDREVNAVSYDINEAIAGIKGQRTIYTDPEQRFIIDASTSTSKYTLTMLGDNELGNYVVPADIDKAITIDGSIKNGATITSESLKTVTINNKSNAPVDIAIISNGTVALTGNFNDVEFDDGTLNGVGSNYANITGNVIISDNAAKATTINANFVGENNTVISNTSQAITINAKNENANVIIECPNSTVTVTGVYDEVEANVADDTLKFTSLNTHINTLHLKHGNIFINNGKNVINDLVGNIVADSSYTVDWNKATVLPNSPAACEYTLSEDKNNPLTWGTFASGNTVINLNGHTIHNNGTDGRPTMNVRGTAVVDINGDGTVSNDNEYTVWGNAVGTTININGGHYIGNTHAIYSYAGTININGGEFELVNEPTADNTDKNGLFKFLLNCYDANFTAGKAHIYVTGGKFHRFNPAEAYGEPTQPWNYVAEGYESVLDDSTNQIYIVRKKS